MPGQESEGHLVEEGQLVVAVHLEEVPKLEEDILKQVDSHNLHPDFQRQRLNILLIDTSKPIIGLVVQEIHLNLRGQAAK